MIRSPDMRAVPVKVVAKALACAVAMFSPALVAAQSAPSDYTWATRYDLDRRVTGTIAPDPDGAGPLAFAAVRNTYDARGFLTKVEKGQLSGWQDETIKPEDWANFNVQQSVDTTYDNAGQKLKEEARTGSVGTINSVMQYSYDAVGRPLCTAVRMDPAQWSGQTDACVPQTSGPNGPDRITRNVYDAAGQLVQVRRAVGTSLEQAYATYAYSANGKRTVVVDANGNRAELRYDGFDRQDRWTFPSTTRPSAFNPATPATALSTAGAVNAADFEEYGYDANGNRTSLKKRDGSTLTYEYDALNRLEWKIVPERSGTPASATRDVYYGYDLRGLQTYARFDSTSGEGLTTVYDGLGRMTSSSLNMDGVTRTLAYEYDANGNRKKLTHPDAQAFSFGYDGLDRMTGAYAGTSASGTALETIAYDNAGRRSGLTGTASDSTSYAYDGASRLQTLTHGFAGGTGNVALTFGYNPASQITTEGRNNDLYAFRGDYNLTRPYAANGLNQYTTAGPASFTYDANGNLTSDGGITYSYDVENRLIGATGRRTATLKYDPMGRLYETSGGSAGVTRYLYDGDELVGEYTSSGTLIRRYLHGADVDDPLVWYEGTGLSDPRYLHANHQGSVIGLATAGGSLLNVNSYDPYGIPGIMNLGRFQYTGQIWIPELGIYHYKARAYSPTLGRFLQTDPIGYDDQINLYAYVGNDPANGRDPDGKCGVFLGACIGAGIEFVSQMASSEGRGRYVAAARALSRGDFKGAVKAAGPSLAKIAIAAVAGQTGAGLATKISGAANMASRAIAGSGLTKVLVNASVNAVGNGTVGSALGGGAQMASNVVSGEKAMKGVQSATIGGGIGGVLGSLGTGAIAGEAQNLATSTGNFIGSAGGVAIPGALSSAAQRGGAAVGAASEKAGTCAAQTIKVGAIECF